MNRLALVAIITLTSLSGPAVTHEALAQAPSDNLEVDYGGGTEASVTLPDAEQGEQVDPVAANGGSEGEPPTVTVRTYRAVGDATFCEGQQTVIIPEDRTDDEVTDAANESFALAYDRTDPADWIGDCPFETDEPVPMVTTDDILAVLRDQLHRPEPVMAPGHGLAGLQMYLETNRPLTYANTVTVSPGGVSIGVEIDATATFTVDWGDGATTGPHDRPGDPYPSGTVTHTYTDAGAYDITVVDTWTIRWRFTGDGWNQAFTADLAPTTLDEFEVQQRQAVRID